jgi:hypothetical protein
MAAVKGGKTLAERFLIDPHFADAFADRLDIAGITPPRMRCILFAAMPLIWYWSYYAGSAP